jgi:hypothetical protein
MSEKEERLRYLGRWIERGGHGILSLYKFAYKFPKDNSSRNYSQLYSRFMSKGAFNDILREAVRHGLVVRREGEESNRKERRYALTAKGIEWARAIEIAMRIDAPVPPGKRQWRF